MAAFFFDYGNAYYSNGHYYNMKSALNHDISCSFTQWW